MIFLIFNPSFDQVSNIEPYHETRDKLNQLIELSNFKLKLMLESPERHPSQRFKMQYDHSLSPTITKKKDTDLSNNDNIFIKKTISQNS